MADKDLKLVMDALFCASALTQLMKAAKDDKERFERVARIADKAWIRYNRRAGRVPGLELVGEAG